MPTSLITCLLPKVPKVIIGATFFIPYLLIQYFNTSSLLVYSKSISISGILILSGFKNLSNNKLYLIGSIVVIPKQYDTKDPAALPLPGPTNISCSLAYLT